LPSRTRNDAAPRLTRALLRRDEADRTDAELLAGFAAGRDAAAIGALVRRHGPMVWGVCRRLLAHHDAEDAFQATFLVLVRKAASVRSPEALANWLYGVAHRTARKARARAARRGEAQLPEAFDAPDPGAGSGHPDDLRPLLDHELARLPARYRTAVVLCDLEGKTRAEVARRLGLPEGTVASRLARGRVLLAKRLARRGLAVTAGSLAVSLPRAAAVLPADVVTTAVGRVGPGGRVSAEVAALAKGVLKAMFITRIKSAAAVLAVVAGLALAAGGLTGEAPPAPERPGGPGAAAPGEADASEVFRAYESNDAAGDERFLGRRVRVASNRWVVKGVARGPGQPRAYLLLVECPDRRPGDAADRQRVPMVFAFRFDAGSRKELAGLEPDQHLTVEGVCEGKTAEASELITFKDCRITKTPKP
jgi:RNA polymerase sigma factor (sigma-70 family)